MANGDGADRPITLGNAEDVHEGLLTGENPEKQGAQAKVDRRQQDHHDAEARVDSQ